MEMYLDWTSPQSALTDEVNAEWTECTSASFWVENPKLRCVFFEGADQNLCVRQAKPPSDIQGRSGAPQSDLIPGYSEDAWKITFLSPDPKQH